MVNGGLRKTAEKGPGQDPGDREQEDRDQLFKPADGDSQRLPGRGSSLFVLSAAPQFTPLRAHGNERNRA